MQRNVPRAKRIGRPLQNLTIVIPAWNEESGLTATLLGLLQNPTLRGATILVVDDGSTDQTAQVAKAHKVGVIRNQRNLGYGASLKLGTRAARTGLVAWFDADGQHKAEDLADMVTLLQRENLDAVIAERSLGGFQDRRRRLGKLVLGWLAGMGTRQRLPDPNCGLRVFRRRIICRYLHLLPDGFSASTTSTMALLKRNYPIVFYPIQSRKRLGGQSSASQIRDGLAAARTILHLTILFDAFRTFSLAAAFISGAGFLYGFGLALYAGKGFPTFALLITLLGVQLFFLGVLCDQISALRLERLEFPGESEG